MSPMSTASQTDQWYASWFDTPYYHILYRDRDYLEAGAFMRRLTDSLHLSKSSHIMDLACGRGRHSMYLNRLGYRVTGVDLSPSSIAYAKAQLRDNTTSTSDVENDQSLLPLDSSRINFEVHNMTVPYDGQFDAVFNLFTSFGYFDDVADNVNTIKAIHSNLKPGGYGVIDFMNAPFVIKNLVAYNEKIEDGITFKQWRRYEKGHIYKDIKFTDQERDYHFTERVSALELADFTNYFKLAGLELIEVYGDYHLNSYDAATSERLIMIVRK
ncbi:methyltransferase [Nonlabens ulvanivorans]|nr:methyltransferase [Nonlabens ulvanivorans]